MDQEPDKNQIRWMISVMFLVVMAAIIQWANPKKAQLLEPSYRMPASHSVLPPDHEIQLHSQATHVTSMQ